MDGPDLTETLIALVSALALVGVANWQLRRPIDRRLFPIVPWLGVQFVAAAIVLVFAAHLVSLLTGHHFTSRNGI
ncbi:MAG TPA: hypothetical protein VMT54_12025 [Candidatus Cybelea sp.]|nr:hypothetical protein [Candidatus Cybelea sp.]